MTKQSLHIVRIAGALAVAAGAVMAADVVRPSRPADAPASRPTSFRERYAILHNQNMFVKDRSRIDQMRTSDERARDTGATTNVVRPPAEVNFLLTGIVFEEGQNRAYIEDTTGPKILRLTVGDSVARGQIAAIEIDAIAYEQPGGQPKWVGIGCDLTGAPISSFSPQASAGGSDRRDGRDGRGGRDGRDATGSSAGVPTPPLPDPNNPNLSLEEKMRLRRAQEIKK